MNQAINLGFNSPSDFIGKTIFEILKDQESAQFINDIDNQVMQGNQTIVSEEKISTPTGEKIYSSQKSPIHDENGEVTGMIGFAMDITEIRRQEELARKERDNLKLIAAKNEAARLRAKAESEEEMRKTVMVLVGDIVHDLRTPIATIRTISSLLESILPNLLEIVDEAETLGAKKLNLISKRQMNALRNNRFVSGLNDAVNLMDEFINTSLVELDNAQKTDQSNLQLVKCSSRRILERTLEAYPFEEIVHHENIAYDFELMGNSILIMKILFNLIRNASDQIRINGKGEIYISTHESKDFNLLIVKDTAGGAAPEILNNMFKPYFSTKKEGTGIGLAFCKEMMKRFGGDLVCNSVYGEYIEFSMFFPKINID